MISPSLLCFRSCTFGLRHPGRAVIACLGRTRVTFQLSSSPDLLSGPFPTGTIYTLRDIRGGKRLRLAFRAEEPVISPPPPPHSLPRPDLARTGPPSNVFSLRWCSSRAFQHQACGFGKKKKKTNFLLPPSPLHPPNHVCSLVRLGQVWLTVCECTRWQFLETGLQRNG